MVPTMIYRLLDHPQLDEYDTASLETLVYGAAPMTPTRLREGLDEFGPVFKQFYGQTEVPNLITTLGKTEHREAVETSQEEWLSSAGLSSRRSMLSAKRASACVRRDALSLRPPTSPKL